MDIFKNIADALIGAKDMAVEKNRKAALINRLRNVISCEEKNCDRAYIALGRYYYHNLRDASNPMTEPYAVEIDISEEKIARTVEHLEKLYGESVKPVPPVSAPAEVTSEEPESSEDEVTEGMVDEALESSGSETAEDGENDELPFE